MKQFLIIAILFTLLTIPLRSFAAVAYDNATVGIPVAEAVSLTFSHTNNATDNDYLLVFTAHSVDKNTGVTYGGTDPEHTMTLLREDVWRGTGNWASVWYLANPAGDANNVVVTANATGWIKAIAATYSGALQDVPHAHNFAKTASGASISTTVTTVATNTLMTGFSRRDSGSVNTTPGAGYTERANEATIGDDAMETQSFSSAGAKTVDVSSGETALMMIYGVALAEPAAETWAGKVTGVPGSSTTKVHDVTLTSTSKVHGR